MKKVLLVVDYQKDFVDGALGFPSAVGLDTGIHRLVSDYMKDPDGIVVVTLDTHYSDYLKTQEGKKLPVEHCIKDTDGWKLYGMTGKLCYGEPSEVILVEKPTFGSIELAKILSDIQDKYGNVESVTVVGIVTNMCTISNAVIAKAALPEAEIIIKKDLVDSFDKELHQKALDVMESMQMTIE